MGIAKYLIQGGLVRKSSKDIKGSFNLNRFFLWAADKYNVPHFDPCCDDDGGEENILDNLPVHFNEQTGQAEYFNGEAWVLLPTDVLAIATTITAFAGGGQGSATLLTGDFNEVTVAATDGDSVKLEPATAGKTVTVKNDGANPIDVFPATGDTINDLAVNTAIRLIPGDTKVFTAINGTNWESNEEKIGVVNGTAAAPSYAFNTQDDMGMYKASATELGFSVGGLQKGGFNTLGLFATVISEQLAGQGIIFNNAITRKNTLSAIDATAVATAAEVAGGVITSTSVAATTITLPDTTALRLQLLGLLSGPGSFFDFFIDNSAGANTVTLVEGAGMTTASALTGGNDLTIAAGEVANFRVYFKTATTSNLARIF